MITTIGFVVGQVFENESLFYYDDGNDVTTFSDPNHIPVFPDEAVSRYTGEQRTACNDDPQCLFDTFETNDPEIGQETLVTNAQLIEQSTSLSKQLKSHKFAYT